MRLKSGPRLARPALEAPAMTVAAAPRFAHYPSLQGRTVVITGGATGIGETLVREFAAQGAKVGFIDLAVEAGHALAAALQDAPTPPLFVPGDLTDIPALRGAIDQIRQAFGPVGALLNNAANDRRHQVAEVTPEFWDQAQAVNLKQVFFATQAVLPDMQALGGGSVVNFGSVSWMLRQGGLAAYASAKAAMHGLSRTLARDLGPHRIRVNTLVPGWVMTEKQLRLWVDDAAREEIKRGQCIGEPLQPEHVARMALFLAADDSAMCTAQTYIVDGGWV